VPIARLIAAALETRAGIIHRDLGEPSRFSLLQVEL
jgi:hypothetical protein